MKQTTPAIGIASGLGAAAIWGAMYVVSKAVLPVIPPFALLSLRLVLGAATLGLVLLFVRKITPSSAPKSGRKWWGILGAGFVGYGVSLGLQFWGTALGTASEASLVTCTTPAFVALFAGPLLKERVGLRQWGAVVLATLGVAAVLVPSLSGPVQNNLMADLLLVGAALTWALYSVLMAKASKGFDLTLASVVGFLGGLPLTLPLGIQEASLQGIGVVTPGIVAGILFLGIVSTALAMALWNHAFRVLPATVAGLTFFAQPLTGTLLGFFFLGEHPGVLFYLGAVLIAGALFVGRNR